MKRLGLNKESKLKLHMTSADYVETGYKPLPGTEPNFYWEGWLFPIGFSRGRSSVRFKFKDECNRVYEMSVNRVADMLQALPRYSIGSKGYGYHGIWTFAKEGSNATVLSGAPFAEEEDE